MNAIIVDDEKKGREILQKFIQDYCPDVHIVASAANPAEAYDAIVTHKPDLVFLDIQMPGGSGFDLLQQFPEINFEVIFITAYDNYAIPAIKHHALDYLLKPIDIDELRTAVAKARKKLDTKQNSNRYHEFLSSRRLEYTSRLGLPVKDGIVYIAVCDIVRVESDLGCSVFYTGDGKKYVAAKNLKDYEDILPGKEFFRIHKSHLVNMKKVKKFIRTDGFFVQMEDGAQVEIARRKKDEFLAAMGAAG